ncbi:DUF3006 domain-containing protein [Thermobrachium celere]|uniref:DUF3006 domain-containing protein n=1 Tax=Thermobrachium celere DSM 8682 TaxID=941824 RepID=R7RM73_9CLOT|nr:DUF3006 domain-containing protein [Thermobrachium celere]CDF57267.1 hypothetical protein TCEL_01181 [Thermobrachium celere DSM 8682]
MKGVVDRIEGNMVVVVLDDEQVVEINIDDFEDKVKEGDVVFKRCLKWAVDYKETEKRKETVEKYLDLFEE